MATYAGGTARICEKTAMICAYGEALYGFEGLRAYKDKFSPDWEPRFIAGSQGLSLGRALIDLQALIAARKH